MALQYLVNSGFKIIADNTVEHTAKEVEDLDVGWPLDNQ